jgi:formylglycine-generating enzyme required for sulfatase activity
MQKVSILTNCAVCLLLALAVCLGCNTGGEDSVPTEDSYAVLQEKITWAEGLMKGVNKSPDGSDIAMVGTWVETTIYEALQTLITSAKSTLREHTAAKAAVDALIADLDSKGNAFTAAKKPGVNGLDKTELETVIAEVEAALEAVVPETNAVNVPRGDEFCTQAVYVALQTALTTAKTAWPLTPAEVTAAADTLRAALTTFNSASKGVGTKVPDVTELEAAITAAGPLPKYNKNGVETDVTVEATGPNIVPGLFLDFEIYWVTDTADTALRTSLTAAQAFVQNVASAGTNAEARSCLDNLTAAIADYTAAKKAGLGLAFIDVPAGSFTRYGGTTGLTGSGYTSTITKAYKMAKYEITVGQWEAVMGTDWPENAGKYDEKISPTTLAADADRARFPATRISWYDAIAFCNRLSALLGKDTVYTVDGVSDWKAITVADINVGARPSGSSNSGPSANTTWDAASADWAKNGYRLPTEWEWQWAAMGAYADATATVTDNVNTTGYRKAYAGQVASAANNAGTTRTGRSDYAWLSLNDSGQEQVLDGTRPVGLKLPNELGIYDMSGNAFEWCWDVGANSGNNQNLDNTAVTEDYRGGTTVGNRRVFHGGDWENTAGVTNDRPSIWNRTGGLQYIGYTQSGIRLVINAE